MKGFLIMRLLFLCSFLASFVFVASAAHAQRATASAPANRANITQTKKLSVEQKAPALVRRNNQRRNIQRDDDFVSAAAQSPAQLLDMIMKMNRIDPQQNPKYSSAKDVLRRNLISGKNKVLGDVRDLVLAKEGGINAISVVLDRLHKRNVIALGYADMGTRSTSGGYKITYSKDQMEELYPTFLANIATAAGTDDEAYSLARIQKAGLYTDAGQKIGMVRDVLFTDEGDRAVGLYVEITAGVVRSKSLAIPFSAARFEEKGMMLSAVLSEEQAGTISDYIKTVD